MSASKSIKPDAIKTSERMLRGIVLLIALAALLFPAAAWADTVVLDQGTLDLGVLHNSTLVQFLVASGPGFGLDTQGTGLGAPTCQPCLPGSVLSTDAGGSGRFGSVTYAGVSYVVTDQLGSHADPNSALVSWSVAGSDILLPPLAPTFSATVPFFISIDAQLFDCASPPCRLRTDVNAIGQGVATFSFTSAVLGGLNWNLSSPAIYDIIPEPSTWLLVPTAVGLAWLARRKRRGT